MFPKFIQVGLYSGERIYGGPGEAGELIFGMLIGLHIWRGRIFGGGLYTGGVLTGFYSIFISVLNTHAPIKTKIIRASKHEFMIKQ